MPVLDVLALPLPAPIELRVRGYAWRGSSSRMIGDIAFWDHVFTSIGNSNMKLNGEKTMNDGHLIFRASMHIAAGVVMEIAISKSVHTPLRRRCVMRLPRRCRRP